MASGRPIISTDIVGVAEDVMRFSAGMIVRPRDINALAQTILGNLVRRRVGRGDEETRVRLVGEKYKLKKIGRDM